MPGGPSNGRVVWDLGDGRTMSHIYQCGAGGSCCDYGYANECEGGGWGRCGWYLGLLPKAVFIGRNMPMAHMTVWIISSSYRAPCFHRIYIPSL